MGRSHKHVIDKDDDDDVYIYWIYIHPDEHDAYWVVVWALKTSEWDWQQQELLVGSECKKDKPSYPNQWWKYR